jgi:hypothetical protein
VASVRASTRKLSRPVLVEILVLVGARRDGVVGGAVGEVLRQVFLDDHLGVEVHVGRGIGDAEPPLPEHPVDAVFEQPETDGKGGIGRGGLAEIARRGSLAAFFGPLATPEAAPAEALADWPAGSMIVGSSVKLSA